MSQNNENRQTRSRKRQNVSNMSPKRDLFSRSDANTLSFHIKNDALSIIRRPPWGHQAARGKVRKSTLYQVLFCSQPIHYQVLFCSHWSCSLWFCSFVVLWFCSRWVGANLLISGGPNQDFYPPMAMFAQPGPLPPGVPFWLVF